MSPRSARVATANADEHGHHRVLGSNSCGNSQGRNSAGSERHPSPSETVRELSALFAAAFLRWTAAGQKGLDSSGQVSVDRVAAVNGPEIPEVEPRSRKECA